MSSGPRGDEMVKERAPAEVPLERRNLRSSRKTKQKGVGKSERHFRNTIVLAPFHALKQGIQNKLKDLFLKGMLEGDDKRIRIPNNSLFQYEVTEMKTGPVNAEPQDKAGEQKKIVPTENRRKLKRKKPAGVDEGEYCRCEKSEKKLANALDALKRIENVKNSASTSFAKNEDAPPQQGPKKRKIQNDEEKVAKPTATSKKVVPLKSGPENVDNKTTKEKPKCGESRRRMSPRIPSQKKSIVRKGVRNVVNRNNLKYKTRSAARKEIQNAAEGNRASGPAGKNSAPNVKHQMTGSEHKKKEKSAMNSKESGRKVEAAEGADRAATKANNLAPLRSDVSILFLEEIRLEKGDDNARHPAGKKSSVEELTSAVAEKCTCSGERKQQTTKQPDEAAGPMMSEVTQMFHTLLRKSTHETQNSNNQSVDHSKKDDADGNNGPNEKETASKKQERTPGRQVADEGSGGTEDDAINDKNIGGDRNLEPNVIVHEAPNECSSSDATSNGSWKVGDTAAKFNFGTYTSNARDISGLGEGLDKPPAYIFGPRSPFHHIRESCEYGFAIPHSLSDDDAEVCDSRNFELDDN